MVFMPSKFFRVITIWIVKRAILLNTPNFLFQSDDIFLIFIFALLQL